MKKTFKVLRDGRWEEIELEVEHSGPFIEYTPPKDMIPPPMMGFIACLVGFLALALIIAALIICFT